MLLLIVFYLLSNTKHVDSIKKRKQSKYRTEEKIEGIRGYTKYKQLEYRVTKLEASNMILSKVNTELSQEVDRLDQYHRRSNVIVKNLLLPMNDEPLASLNKKVTHIFNNDLGVNETIINDVDKIHRLGKIKKNKNGKQTQDVIVRFKSHSLAMP